MKNTFLLKIIFTFFLLFSLTQSFSQISYTTSKAVMIFQFAKNISHQNYKDLDEYRICFLGEDNETFQELAKISANNKINGKTVKLFITNDLSKIPEIELLYIDKKWSQNIKDIWFLIENKNILLVSEQSPDPKYIMLNILYNELEKKISFEINKANIIIENFIIDPELLLLGGKDVDLRELFREMRQELENEKKEVELYKKTIKNQTTELLSLHKQADSLKDNIDVLLNKISLSGDKLTYLMDSVKIQQDILASKLKQITDQEIKLENQKIEIIIKEIDINNKKNELNLIIAEKNKQQEIIKKQNRTLSTQKNIITTKTKQLFLFYGIVFLLFAVIFLVLYAYRIRKKTVEAQLKTNKKLENQKLILEKTLQQLNATQSQLIQSEKMASLGVLTAGIAHEINNPINYINSGLEGLNTISDQIIKTISKFQQLQSKKTDIDKQNIQEELSFLSVGIQTLTTNIQTGVNRTTEIIKSLKTFSHADNNSLSLSDINQDLDSTLLLLHNQLKNRIKIIRNYEKIPKLYCYSSKLNQVFMNLLSNAIQAIEGKGTITISTTLIENYFEFDQNCIKISIHDTGAGIPEKIQNKIFEPFFTTKEVGQGTGLGLSITHSIIKQHKGKIELSSSKNKGTEFEIYLPIIDFKKTQNKKTI